MASEVLGFVGGTSFLSPRCSVVVRPVVVKSSIVQRLLAEVVHTPRFPLLPGSGQMLSLNMTNDGQKPQEDVSQRACPEVENCRCRRWVLNKVWPEER